MKHITISTPTHRSLARYILQATTSHDDDILQFLLALSWRLYTHNANSIVPTPARTNLLHFHDELYDLAHGASQFCTNCSQDCSKCYRTLKLHMHPPRTAPLKGTEHVPTAVEGTPSYPPDHCQGSALAR